MESLLQKRWISAAEMVTIAGDIANTARNGVSGSQFSVEDR